MLIIQIFGLQLSLKVYFSKAFESKGKCICPLEDWEGTVVISDARHSSFMAATIAVNRIFPLQISKMYIWAFLDILAGMLNVGNLIPF